MKFGYGCVKPMGEELLAFMEKHRFNTVADFKGRSLPFFTTHFELAQKQAQRKAAQEAGAPKKAGGAEGDWRGDSFAQQSNELSGS
jgi:dihydropyrimidine dehydrogenase (NADP+)/dihydropyrimidine dehydrogenase (NAD+) subunit PreA